jgi:hypothetical protein
LFSLSLVGCISVAMETCLSSHYHTMIVSSGSATPVFQLPCHNMLQWIIHKCETIHHKQQYKYKPKIYVFIF